MRCLLVGLMMSLLAWGWAMAAEETPADAGQAAVAPAAVDESTLGKGEVTGIPLYDGPQYDTLDSHKDDITRTPPQFHAFQQLPVSTVGYSPLTLADFRYPVAKRSMLEFNWERMDYPRHTQVAWHDRCKGYTVTAFFFTRDAVRDHIQRLIDEYYVCDPAIVQQLIDYYAEVTPQCGEAISWVWFAVDNKGNHYADRQENPYFSKYLYNFKDKFYLEFGLPKVQDKVDTEVHDFLYQYRDRGKFCCGPEFVERPCPSCDKCADKAAKCKDGGCGELTQICDDCPDCGKAQPCVEEFKKACYASGDCPDKASRPCDEGLYCTDFKYHGFNIDVNSHYLYYPRKVVIEDMTYDPVAQAYRWKFAWRFDNCEVDWLKQMCQYGEKVQFALVLSDPHWYGYAPLTHELKRDILAAVDPSTWGNVWPASNLPYDMTCCKCPLPDCDGNCTQPVPVGWGYVEPTPEAPAVEAPPAEAPPAEDFNFFPPEEPKEEIINVPGKG